MGDPAGIGPEIILKAALKLLPRLESGELALVIAGKKDALEGARTLVRDAPAIPVVDENEAEWPALAMVAVWIGRTRLTDAVPLG